MDVRRFGAKGDGQTLDAAAVQAAIDHCHDLGGGSVLFQPGLTFLIGTIYLKDHVYLQLEPNSTILGSDQLADYGNDVGLNPFYGRPGAGRGHVLVAGGRRRRLHRRRLVYTGGPRPYGYHGLGEVFVFAFFGVVAVAGTAYVEMSRFSWLGLVASVPAGLLACALLIVNNLRDIPTPGRRLTA